MGTRVQGMRSTTRAFHDTQHTDIEHQTVPPTLWYSSSEEDESTTKAHTQPKQHIEVAEFTTRHAGTERMANVQAGMV